MQSLVSVGAANMQSPIRRRVAPCCSCAVLCCAVLQRVDLGARLGHGEPCRLPQNVGGWFAASRSREEGGRWRRRGGAAVGSARNRGQLQHLRSARAGVTFDHILRRRDRVWGTERGTPASDCAKCGGSARHRVWWHA